MKRTTMLCLLLSLVCIPLHSISAEEVVNPKDVAVGLLKIYLNSDYVAVQVDGDSWDKMYFEDNGKTLVLEKFDRTASHTLDLMPIYEELKPETVEIKPKDWKLKRLDRTTKQWQASKKVKFRNWKPGEKEAMEKAKEDAAKKEAEKAAEDSEPEVEGK